MSEPILNDMIPDAVLTEMAQMIDIGISRIGHPVGMGIGCGLEWGKKLALLALVPLTSNRED